MKRGTGPRLVAVETSSGTFSVASCGPEGAGKGFASDGMGRPSELLMELIEKGAGGPKGLAGCDGFAVSIGPGSFTSLRVGVMTVKTLAWALKKPVLPVSSLEVLAHNLAAEKGRICAFVDAHKKKVYSALFSSDGKGGIRRESEDRLDYPEKVLERLDGDAWLVGSGIRRYAQLVEGRPLAPEKSWVPEASSLCRIAVSRWPAGALDDPHRLVPKYLYSQESDITGW